MAATLSAPNSGAQGAFAWPALIRKANRLDTSYQT